MRNLAERVRAHRRVLAGLVTKNLREKYSGAYLGIFWALLNPLLLTAVIALVFTRILKTDVPRYPVFVLSGLLPWFFFVNSVTEGTSSYQANKQLMQRFVFPRELIPLSVTLASFLNFLLGFVIVFPFFVVTASRPLVPAVFLLPAVMALHFLFAYGVTLIFSTVNVYIRDLAQLLTVLMMFLFWATPVFYPVAWIPESSRWIVDMNPAAGFVHLYHSLLYDGLPGEPRVWLVSCAWAAIMLLAGYSILLKREHELLKSV